MRMSCSVDGALPIAIMIGSWTWSIDMSEFNDTSWVLPQLYHQASTLAWWCLLVTAPGVRLDAGYGLLVRSSNILKKRRHTASGSRAKGNP